MNLGQVQSASVHVWLRVRQRVSPAVVFNISALHCALCPGDECRHNMLLELNLVPGLQSFTSQLDSIDIPQGTVVVTKEWCSYQSFCEWMFGEQQCNKPEL